MPVQKASVVAHQALRLAVVELSGAQRSRFQTLTLLIQYSGAWDYLFLLTSHRSLWQEAQFKNLCLIKYGRNSRPGLSTYPHISPFIISVHYILLPSRIHDIFWNQAFSWLYTRGSCCLTPPRPPPPANMLDDLLLILQGQLNIRSSARLVPPTTLLSSSSLELPGYLTGKSFSQAFPVKGQRVSSDLQALLSLLQLFNPV